MSYRKVLKKAVTSGKEIFNILKLYYRFFKETLPENGIKFLSNIDPIISINTLIEIFSDVKADDK